jgi:UDP-N-acetylglucosamine 2-epimerase (non-hydrolysing)
MHRIKVCSVFGTRPEAIKMAPVVLELQSRANDFEHVLVVTGQHRAMLDQMLSLFGLTPDHDLDIMQARQTLTHVTTATLTRIEDVFKKVRPDVVLVHGDTSTSFVSGLAAYYQQIPVGHVEAGLRTGDKYNPFPEEMNRRLIDSLADLLFAPTRAAADALIAENADPNAIYITGNTVIDALLTVAEKPGPETLLPEISPHARIILVEAHRRENLGQPMEQICQALLDLAQRPDVHIVFPVHLNPAVRDTVMPMLQGRERISLLEPCDYLPFVFLMKRAAIILTDSGGIQEEGPSLKSPVLVLRKTTERPEAIEAGTAVLVGPDRDAIVRHAARLLDDPAAYEQMTGAMNPYGDGRAAARIADALLHYFKRLPHRPPDYSGA